VANWKYTTRTVAEGPVAWNPLHERYRMNRAISVQEVSPGVYEEVRYDAYTQELGAVNLPPVNNPPQYEQPSAGLHYFRGGYEWIVDDQVRADLINSGVADASNFVPA
jgi:hypothetical protein